jgi:type VI secretion system secreted protein Hcp
MGIGATVSRRGGTMGKIILLVSVFTLLCAGAANAYLFLRFDTIMGDSQNAKHKNEIDVSTVDWGVSATAPSGRTGGAGTSRPVFTDLKWTQVMDSSFPLLFDALATGEHISKAAIYFTAAGAHEYTYFQMLFDDVFLTSLNLHGTSGSKPMVDGSFAYGKITMTYWRTNPDGSIGSSTTASYDLDTGAGSVGALGLLFSMGLAGPTEGPTDGGKVPIPAAIVLLGSGLAGLAGLRWKFRR